MTAVSKTIQTSCDQNKAKKIGKKTQKEHLILAIASN